MKWETMSACHSIENAYNNPQYFKPKQIIDLWEEYHLGLYMKFKFVFIYCLQDPIHIEPYSKNPFYEEDIMDREYYKDVVKVYGGVYKIVSYRSWYFDEDDKIEYIINANDPEDISFSGDSRPYFRHNAVNDFIDKHIIIMSVKDYENDYPFKDKKICISATAYEFKDSELYIKGSVELK